MRGNWPVSTLVSVLVLIASTPQALALDTDHLNVPTGDCASTQTAYAYRFIGTQGWPDIVNGQSKRDWAADGFEYWNTALDADGSQIVDIAPWSSGTSREVIDVYLDPTPSPDNDYTVYGYADCLLQRIEINASLGSGISFRSVAAHEFGHILDQGHVGDAASYDGVNSLMATCQAPDVGAYAQDDESGLEDKRAHGGSFVTANVGFERGLTYFGSSGSLSLYSGAGAFVGNKYAGFTRTTSTSSLYETSTITHGAGNSVRTRVAMKTPANGYSGSVKLQIQLASYVPTTNTEACFRDGVDENSLARPNTFTAFDEVAIGSITTTWNLYQTALVPLNGNVTDPNYAGVRARLLNDLNSSGIYRQVYVDNLRLQES